MSLARGGLLGIGRCSVAWGLAEPTTIAPAILPGRRSAVLAPRLAQAELSLPARSALLVGWLAVATLTLPARSALTTIPRREAVMTSPYFVGDTRPAYTSTLRLDRVAHAIPDGVTVLLVYARTSDGVEVERECEIVDQAAGTVSYSWQVGELVEGTYRTRIVLDWGGGVRESYDGSEIMVRRMV